MKHRPGRMVRQDRLLRVPLDLGARRQEPGADRAGPVERGRGRAGALRAHHRRLPPRADRHDGRRPLAPDHPDPAAEGRSRSQKLREAFAEYQRQKAASAKATRRRTVSDPGLETRRQHHEFAKEVLDVWSAAAGFVIAPRAGRPVRAARRAAREARRAARAPPTSPSRRRKPTSRRAISTSTTCSPRAGTRARSTSTACRRCATSRRSRSSRPTPPPGYGFDDESKAMLGRPDLGRRAPPGALGDQRRLRRPVALRQRHERPRSRGSTCATSRPSRSCGPVPNVSGNHVRAFVTPEHRVRDDGAPASRSRSRRARSRPSTSTRPTTRASSPASRSTRRRARCRSAGRS